MTEHGRATLGGGCFWCLEAAFAELPAVSSVTSGYAAGDTPDPSYEAVCTGTTGHAEVVQIDFDPERMGFRELLEVFFAIHDPTQVDRQGPDVGSQYRSIILYHDDDQRAIAETFLEDAATAYDEPIATELEPLDKFYPAEAYHQDYFANNPDAAYCRIYVAPKAEKVRSTFVPTSSK